MYVIIHKKKYFEFIEESQIQVVIVRQVSVVKILRKTSTLYYRNGIALTYSVKGHTFRMSYPVRHPNRRYISRSWARYPPIRGCHLLYHTGPKHK